MKTLALVFCLISCASAAPAVVWKSGTQNKDAIHSSEDVTAADILADSLDVVPGESALAAVVFLLSRGQDGSERLSSLASRGVLPGVSAKYDDSDCIYHNVGGVESPHTVVRDASRTSTGQNVLQVSLGEYSSRLASLKEPVNEMEVSTSGLVSKTEKYANKRARAIAEATVLVVSIDESADPSEIDSAIVGAIEHVDVGNVVLSSVRSSDEVKLERRKEARRRLEMMHIAGRKMQTYGSRRRLEDQGQDDAVDDGQNDANQENMSDIHYVYMTPNILAGILFFFLFTLTTFIGVSCMGAIRGQEIFASKMPAIGREA